MLVFACTICGLSSYTVKAVIVIVLAGLNTWHEVESKNVKFALAIRMLYACTRRKARRDDYGDFLVQHASMLSNLHPYDVLVFIATTCNISQKQPCCISFGFDEVEAHCLCGCTLNLKHVCVWLCVCLGGCCILSLAQKLTMWLESALISASQLQPVFQLLMSMQSGLHISLLLYILQEDHLV